MKTRKSRKGRSPKVPLTLDEAHNLVNESERVFAIALCSIPHLVVYHEPKAFYSPKDNRHTTPDFLVVNTRRRGTRGVYIEVTKSESLETHSKLRQKRIMDDCSRLGQEKVKYYQYSKEVMDRLLARQRVHV